MDRPETKHGFNPFTFFVRRYKVAYIVGFLIIIAGILSIIRIPKESAPFIPYGAVSVTTVYPGASAKDVDNLVTQKLESRLKNVSGIDSIRSQSSGGVSSISLSFQPDENMVRALSDIRSKIDEVKNELPSEVETDPVITEIDSTLEPFLHVLLSGEADAMALRDTGEDLKTVLENVSGVAKVTITGGDVRQILVDLEPSKLSSFGVTSDDVVRTIGSSHRNTPIGDLTISDLDYNVRFEGRHEDASDIARLQIRDSSPTGVSIVRVSDLGDVYEDGAESDSFFRTGTKEDPEFRETVRLAILKKQGTNIFDVDERVRSSIDAFTQEHLSEEMNIRYANELAEIIEEDYALVINSSRSSVIVIFLIILVFVGLVEGFVAGLVLPLTLLGTITFLSFTGSTLNFMTNFSMVLALGILVDTAIVIVEGCHDGIRRGLSPADASIAAVKEFSGPLISGSLTTLAVFIPLVTLPGVLGKYLSFVPITVSIILILSLLTSLFLIPAYASKLLGRKSLFREGSFLGDTGKKIRGFFEHGVRATTRMYGWKLKWLMAKRFRRIGALYLVIILFFASWMLPVKFQLFPGGDQPFMEVLVKQPIGTVREETLEHVIPVESLILEQPEVKLVTTSVNGNEASVRIELYESDERKRLGLRNSVDLTNDLMNVFEKTDDSEIRVRNEQNGPPSEAPVAIRVIAVDNSKLDTASQVVSDFKKILKEIPGTFGVRDDIAVTPGELRFRLNRDKALALGVQPDQVPSVIRTAFRGSTAATITRDGRDIDTVVRFAEEHRDSIEDLENIQIRNGNGVNISLAQIVDYELYYGLNSIQRVDNNIAFTVSSLLDENGNAAEITSAFMEKIGDYELPDGIQVKTAGENEENAELFAALGSGAAMAFLIMLLILVIQFNSYIQPFIILSTLVFAMLGVNFGLFITSTPRSLAFILGIIALMGIVVNDAIIMIDQINKNRERVGSEPTPGVLQEVIARSGVSRFTPITLTTLTTAAGIIPLVFVDTFWAGLGYTVIFGLCMASFMTLFITPVIYYQLWHEKAVTFLPLGIVGLFLGGVGSIFGGNYIPAGVMLVISYVLFIWLRKSVRRLEIENV